MRRKRNRRVIGKVACASIIGVLIAQALLGATVVAEDLSPRAVERAIYNRERFGLPAAPELVRALMQSTEDVGTSAWAFPMTAEEERVIALADRTASLHAIEKSFLPYARSLPSYAGMWQDRAKGGEIVVMLTEPTSESVRELGRRLPEASLSMRVEQATATYEKLSKALADADARVEAALPGVKVAGAAISQQYNLLIIEVPDESLGRGRASRT